jgi:antitoxin YefM
MKAINYTEFRKSMKENMDLAVDSSETIVIQRAGGKTVVMVSLAEYNSIVETNYLLSTEANSKNLEKSIKDYKKGKTRTLNLGEL